MMKKYFITFILCAGIGLAGLGEINSINIQSRREIFIHQPNGIEPIDPVVPVMPPK